MTLRPLLAAVIATALYAVVLVTTASAQPPAPTPVATPQLPAAPTAAPTTAPPAPAPAPAPAAPTPAAPTPAPTDPGAVPAPAPTAPATAESPPQGNTESLEGDVDDYKRKGKKARERERDTAPAGRRLDGTPTVDNPTFSLALPGAAPIGVPNFFIDKFRIPPFLLSIYQAAGVEYGIRWEVLAAINEIETDYGRNLNVSSAGALGWMQFMPATWRVYGVDANRDGAKDPFNPVDAIFAAARYLRAAGADQDIRQAIFAYNHADWYVDSVLLRARVIGGIPSNLVGSLTGLTQGRFPVTAKATYADDISERDIEALEGEGNQAVVVESGRDRRGIRIFARRRTPVIAVNDGRIVAIGRSKRLGRFVKLQDVYGNTYTYGHLGKVAERYPAPKPRRLSRQQVQRELALPERDAAPTRAASAAKEPAARGPRRSTARKASPSARRRVDRRDARQATTPSAGRARKERLFANPRRPRSAEAGGAQQEFERTGRVDGATTLEGSLGVERSELRLKTLKRGSRVVAGTVLGRIGKRSRSAAPHALFEIRPAGRGAPRIDPKPILDGWKLLESTAIYRAEGRNPFFGSDADAPSIGQILLMSKEALAQRVVENPRIAIYGCGRRDVQAGQIDRRVLATLEFLAASGFKPTVTSLKCGHSFLTASGNVSHHSSGNAVDIAAINGIPILGHQGPGSITELTIQRLMTLQGTMQPSQIISLMEFEGVANTFAMGDHADHIHVGWKPLFGTNSKAVKQVNAILKPKQWIKLIDRLGEIDNPTVRRKPSRYSLDATRAPRRGSEAHKGE